MRKGRRVPKWESELWRYIAVGEEIDCPSYLTCRQKRSGQCISDDKEHLEPTCRFFDRDRIGPHDHEKAEILGRSQGSRIFSLVARLAEDRVEERRVERLPIPEDIIRVADDGRPIEVRLLRLEAHHGAVWRMSDAWIIQLRRDDPPERRRFTLYHEVFHILARCHGRAASIVTQRLCLSCYNELLADCFAAAVLAPSKWVGAVWPRSTGLDEISVLFQIPQAAMLFRLRSLSLI